MEKLTKSQVILLTLLVSFVTSIATGIVTVTLVDQAPPAIVQTLEHVIERTVEKVTPGDQTAAAAVTTEKTVIVKESDLISQAIARVNPSVVRIYTGVPEALEFLGLGFVISKNGMVMTDLSALPQEGGAIYLTLSDNTQVKGVVFARQGESDLAIIQGATTTAGVKVAWKPGVISSGSPVLGQTVIDIAGRNSTRIGDGIVVALSGTSGNSVSAPRNVVETNIPKEFIYSGSPLINTNGEIMGISTSASRAILEGGFIASSAILAHIKASSQ